jgi:hypothetical protein
MPTGSKEKTAAGKKKLREPVKILLRFRNKMIQRTLGVKVDGIMGTKSMAALEAMKQTQISLDLPTKTLTELEESKPLQLMQGIKKCLLRLWHQKSQLLLIDLWIYKNCSSRAI